jgi:hypothetical protein
MTLTKVEYEFFDFEEPSTTPRELHRQIRLHFSDSATLYVSWTSERQWGPECEPYSIAYRPASFCSGEAAIVVDASASPLWSGHIGQEVAVAYVPASNPEDEWQVVEVRSPTNCTFVYSRSRDRISVADRSPIGA